ncbi:MULTISPECIES: class I SAM-dependent methyltransferase [unclassified Caballeronia]|uniref:class I SAM-dependent methyltransferase n=1 Tax=unclassified Caballeronia TaxID=2646786 RepID=UPI0028627F6B|nr:MULTISPECIES: class I SAM-dependent methyltransferase [unclassified Caballeronia]MDR5777635.1 class I SAM-dependent methyltransferase [Caballeronia sp. LZ002]MDR5801904.1 class I SAM-dependent methyltransferase [Caballeronia sp. LZ001]MDR5853071.1 class I SAM-dependent methyltransferase [Caballeronia sp. LZ003]
MIRSAESFYDDMASSYHLIFDNWDEAIERQRAVLAPLISESGVLGTILDCACGIGTQALSLARAGYKVEGTDISKTEVERAAREAALRNLSVEFRVDDMRLLVTCKAQYYGAVVAFDNAIPHLDSDEEIAQALTAMLRCLRARGKIFVSLRDYGTLLTQRPIVLPPSLFMDNGLRRIVHQVWDWQDARRYTVHLYITRQTSGLDWQLSHFVGRYRAITPEELATLAMQVGFNDVQVLSPTVTGYYQPIVTATAP